MLSTWGDACRSLYNSALQDRQVAYDKDKSTLSYYDQTTELTKMRARLESATGEVGCSEGASPSSLTVFPSGFGTKEPNGKV